MNKLVRPKLEMTSLERNIVEKSVELLAYIRKICSHFNNAKWYGNGIRIRHSANPHSTD